MGSMLTAVHPVLMCRTVDETLRFYQRLGFVEVFRDRPEDPQYAGIERDGIELHLQWGDPSQWDHSGDRPAYRFLSSNVDALHAEFVASGAVDADRAEGPWSIPADTPWGTREFHLRDPGGNVLQFYRLSCPASLG